MASDGYTKGCYFAWTAGLGNSFVPVVYPEGYNLTEAKTILWKTVLSPDDKLLPLKKLAEKFPLAKVFET